MTGALLMVKSAKGKGRGVFAARAITSGEVVIEDQCVILPGAQYRTVKRTVLGEYYFDWYGERFIVMGLGSLLNHSLKPNCDWSYEKGVITFKAIKAIKRGEELVYDYGRDEYLWE